MTRLLTKYADSRFRTYQKGCCQCTGANSFAPNTLYHREGGGSNRVKYTNIMGRFCAGCRVGIWFVGVHLTLPYQVPQGQTCHLPIKFQFAGSLNNAMHPNTLSRGEGVSEADGSGMRVEIIDLPICRRLFAMFYCTPFHPLSPPPREGVWYGTLFEAAL